MRRTDPMRKKIDANIFFTLELDSLLCNYNTKVFLFSTLIRRANICVFQQRGGMKKKKNESTTMFRFDSDFNNQLRDFIKQTKFNTCIRIQKRKLQKNQFGLKRCLVMFHFRE